MFYNTIDLKNPDLQTATGQSQAQDERILNHFKARPLALLTPDEVLLALFGDNVPITSVRRSMTNLTTQLFLEKTSTMKKGKYGKLTHCWKLREIITWQLSLFP